MKKIHFYIFIFFFVCLFVWKKQNITKVAFLGDSITELGIKDNGYINQLDSILKKESWFINYKLLGAGVSGNKLYDAFIRYKKDLISKRPDIAVLFIGVNDAGHKSEHIGEDTLKFIRNYQEIIDDLKNNEIQIIICTPAVIGEFLNLKNPLDPELEIYSNIIRDLAKKNNLPIVDLRKIFSLQLKIINKSDNVEGNLTVDGLHLNYKGNLLVAEKIWDVLKGM
jgi:isoamyl acetate esterase